jgi:hypothetical protein
VDINDENDKKNNDLVVFNNTRYKVFSIFSKDRPPQKQIDAVRENDYIPVKLKMLLKLNQTRVFEVIEVLS